MSQFNDTLRIYDESSLRYTYHTQYFNLEDRYCCVRYPDGTRLFMLDKQRVIEHIKYHRKHISMSYKMNPPYNYSAKYVEHFEPFRKRIINQKFDDKYGIYDNSFKRDKITINELLNSEQDNSNLNVNKIAINNILNSEQDNRNLNINKIAISDTLNSENNNNNNIKRNMSINNLLN